VKRSLADMRKSEERTLNRIGTRGGEARKKSERQDDLLEWGCRRNGKISTDGRGKRGHKKDQSLRLFFQSAHSGGRCPARRNQK